MGIELFWDTDDADVLVMAFDEHWTGEQYQDILTQLQQVSDEREQLFHVIVDARQMKVYSSALMLNFGQHGVQRIPAKSACVVVLTENPLLETLVRTTSALYPVLHHKLYCAQSYTSARRIIQHYEKRQAPLRYPERLQDTL